MKKIYGVGINNANYPINWTVDGQHFRCKIFQRWKSMLSRCYSKTPTPRLPAVCREWLEFMEFHNWIKDQSYEQYVLDKDILVSGNTLYCPERCILIPSRTNSLLTDSRKARGLYPLGVNKKKELYQANCGILGKQVYLGVYPDPNSAHKAWQEAKSSAIQNEIDWLNSINFEDTRIYEPLEVRITKLKEDWGSNRITIEL